MAKRVLILAYDFLPSNSPGAAIRTSKFANYLPEFGWQPVVAARLESGLATTEEPEKVIRIRAPRIAISYQATAWLWAANAWWQLRKVVRQNDFQLIFVSCPPFPLGLVAASLAERSSMPLVVDFRDAWSLDPYRPRHRIKAALKSGLCRWLWPRLERRVLEAADTLLVASDSSREAYKRILPLQTSGPVVLPNGFDERDFPPHTGAADEPTRAAQRPCLNLLYCGRFAAVGNRSPEWLLQALKALNDEGLTIKLTILGDDSKAVKHLVGQTETRDIVSTLPTTNHKSAIEAMYNCDALLVYQEQSVNGLSAVAGKTYEYIRVGKPILAVAPPGDNTDLVKRYAGYALYCARKDKEELMGALRKLHGKWCDGTLPKFSPAKEDYLARFNRRAQSEELASVFDRVVSRSR